MKLLPHILELAATVPAQSVFDGFAGTTRVSQAFSKRGYVVATNDVAVWSKVFATCYLRNKQAPESYQALIDHLNNVPSLDGWFTENYGGRETDSGAIQSDGLKRPWQIHNTRRLDGIRTEIDRLDLDEVEFAVAITSLILALDKVDSTLGHYVSYLKDWSSRSYKEMKLEVPLLYRNEPDHQIFNADIFETIDRVETDLSYFDPPYGSNNEKMPPSRVRYASYYHLWKTICENDQPELVGKARRRVDCGDRVAASVFEEFRRNDETSRYFAVEAIEELLRLTRSKWIMLSYSSSGRATAGELRDVLVSIGNIIAVREIDYRRNVMSSMRWTDDWISNAESRNRELLFLLEKS